VYTHWTFSRAFWSSKSKSTYDPRTGATTVPMPLNAWERLMRISEYFGGPQTRPCQRGRASQTGTGPLLAMYGLAAVSREPRPFPMMKMQAQKPPNECSLMAGIARRAPSPSGRMLAFSVASIANHDYRRGKAPRYTQLDNHSDGGSTPRGPGMPRDRH
jgi:hypothetical protein